MADAEQEAGTLVEQGDGARVVIALEKEAGQRASEESLFAETEAEAEIETVWQQLAQLGGSASVAVPNPRLCGVSLPTQGKTFINGTHTMEKEGLAQTLAFGDAAQERLTLKSQGRGAKLVYSTLANGTNTAAVWRRRGSVERPRMNAPSITTVNYGGLSLERGRVVGVEID